MSPPHRDYSYWKILTNHRHWKPSLASLSILLQKDAQTGKTRMSGGTMIHGNDRKTHGLTSISYSISQPLLLSIALTGQ